MECLALTLYHLSDERESAAILSARYQSTGFCLQTKITREIQDDLTGNDHMNEFTLDAKKKTEKARTSSRDTFDNKDADTRLYLTPIFVRIFKSM